MDIMGGHVTDEMLEVRRQAFENNYSAGAFLPRLPFWRGRRRRWDAIAAATAACQLD